MRLYIIRHADPDYENDTITKAGHKEAQALAKRMAAEGLDKIYCSPLGRAKDTMKYTADLLKMEYNIEEWTREMWPELVLTGSPWGDIMAMDIPGEEFRCGENLPTGENWHKCKHFDGFKIKETFEDLQNKSDAFLLRQGYGREGGRYRILRPNNEKVAVFCHCGFGMTWLAHLLELPLTLVWSGIWMAPSSVTVVLFEERTPGYAVPRCIYLGDTSHLYEAGLPMSSRGILANFY